jgi:hypothetical protein
MKNKKLVVSIHGREALPVRAIPFVTGRLMSAEDVAKNLARNVGKTFSQLQNLSAYHLIDGEPAPIAAKEWDAVAARLDALEADLRAQYPNDDQGYAAWLSKSVALLPDGVFVWLDEFENDFFEDFSDDRVSFVDEREGERALAYAPMMSDEERALVLAGFGVLQFDVDETQTIANDEDVAGVAELVRNGTPIDWQYWADRQNITAQQAARLAHCIDPMRWPDDQFKQGQMPDELRIKIQRLSEWLDEREQKWSLQTMMDALGEGASPFLMKEAVRQTRREEALTNTQGRQTVAGSTNGLTKAQILAVDWPLLGDFSQHSLKRALTDVPKWLESARLSKGARGKGKGSALWSPALIAEGLVDKNHANRKAMTSFIRSRFYDWFEEWERLQDYS